MRSNNRGDKEPRARQGGERAKEGFAHPFSLQWSLSKKSPVHGVEGGSVPCGPGFCPGMVYDMALKAAHAGSLNRLRCRKREEALTSTRPAECGEVEQWKIDRERRGANLFFVPVRHGEIKYDLRRYGSSFRPFALIFDIDCWVLLA